MKSLLGVVLLMVLSLNVQGHPRNKRAAASVLCESWKFVHKDCTLEKEIASVTLDNQVSKTKCCSEACDGNPANYGINGNVLWVNKGCRAHFTVTYASEPECQDSQVNDEVTLRALNFKGGNWLNIFLDHKFAHAGKVYEWEYYVGKAGNFFASVWRPLGNNKYLLVGKNHITTAGQGRAKYSVPEGERIPVEAGDVFGVHYSANNADNEGVVAYERNNPTTDALKNAKYTLSDCANTKLWDPSLPVGVEVKRGVQLKKSPALVAYYGTCDHDCDGTGSACITSCNGKADDDYQSCEGCSVYITCANGHKFDNRPCAPTHPGQPPLQWDDNRKRCEWTSDTCVECGGPTDPPKCNPGDDRCVASCGGKADGDYQSCQGCKVYATCSNGHMFDNRPCPANLKWDDDKKRCEWTSPTCDCD